MKIEHGFAGMLLLATGCAASHDECQTWWEAAVRADECSVVVPAAPPVDGPEDVTCAPEEELAAGGVVSGYEECVEYLEAHADSCTPLSPDDPRTAACTTDVVESWEPSPEASACEQWRQLARERAACDPEYFADVGDEPCVADEARIADCVDLLMENAYPCRVPLGEDRARCAPQQILQR